MGNFDYHHAYDTYRYAVNTRRTEYFNNEPVGISFELQCDARQFAAKNGYIKLFKGHSKNELYIRNKELIKRVIFNEPYTIVVWVSGEKTIVKAQDGEPYDKEKGLAMCFAKYFLGNTCRYFDFFKEVCGEEEESKPTVLQKIKAREKKMRKEWGDKDE